MPIIPIAMVYAGVCVHKLKQLQMQKTLVGCFIILLLANVGALLYMSLLHQVHTIAAS